MCRGRDDGGVFNPVAAGRVAAAETQTPLGTHVQRGETGEVGVEFGFKWDSQKLSHQR